MKEKHKYEGEKTNINSEGDIPYKYSEDNHNDKKLGMILIINNYTLKLQLQSDENAPWSYFFSF